jgi:photosystem II stability/assembly factor-like uncharacterized protein/chorismate mutase
MRKFSLFQIVLGCFLTFVFVVQPVNSNAQQAAQANPLKNLQWRSIGPYRGGRVTAVAGVASQPMVYYMGATGGGVWKTTDGGATWEPVSDGFFKTGSVGSIAVADSDPNIVYVGMGESPVRGNVSHGDGMYKSSDAGKTWKKIGLEDTRQIGRVRVHPKNADVVYVAALGHLFGPNEQRGLFRSKDGGKNWEKILYRNDKAGAFDLSFDSANPSVMFATFWQVKRTPYSLESGGDGSGIFKSTDGGDTWTEISRNPGLPKGTLGKLGISVSPVNPQRVWAMVEAQEGGLYRSDNGGETWIRTSDNSNIRQRPWYYTRVYADTQNADIVYVLNVQVWKSTDGGRTFANVPTPHGDNHDWWIAPNDNQRMIGGDDGGAHVTFTGGRTWSEQDQATAQFYRLALDNDFPYNIYGAQQDNSTVKIPSRTADFSINESHWYDVGGGESGWIAPHPKNSDIVFAGSYGGLLTRYDHRTKQQENVSPYPNNPMGSGADVLKYRFQWNFPILFSPHQTNGVYPLYAAANVLFRSMDEGKSWEVISPDLTRNDKSKQGPSGGPISKDNTSVEYYCTIFALSESPVKQGVIWAGSDDGLIHITKDNGKNWEKVTPTGIPEWVQINSIDASPHDAATAYVAGTAYKSDDFRPFLYKTNDYGKTWTKIVNGIPNDAFTRVVREDPNRKGFLYAGTETGIYYSTDDGANWKSLQLNLPIVPITDLQIQKRESDLVVSTQGRSFWVLDDLPILYRLADAQATDAFLFKPEDAYRTPGFGFNFPVTVPQGSNPANGVVVSYYLKEKPTKEVTLEFLDASGKSIRKFVGIPASGGGTQGAPAGPTQFFGGGGGEPPLPVDVGLNRFVWNLRLPNATTVPGMIMWAAGTQGPRIVPGQYQVRLSIGDKVIGTETFQLKADPRISTTQADFQKQFDFMLKIRDKVSATHDAILEIRDIRKQLEDFSARLKDPSQKEIVDKAREIAKQLTGIEEELYQTKARSSQDLLNFPIKLNNKLAALLGVVDSADTTPTAQSYAVYDELVALIDVQLARFAKMKTDDIAAFNKMVADKKVPAILVKEKK